MELPYSAQPVLAHFDFGANDVLIQSSTSTPNIVNVVDQVSSQGAFQTTVASQPTFSLSKYGVVPFYHAAAFNGSSQVLTFDYLAPLVATMNSFTVFVAFQATVTTGTQDLFTFGKTGADGYWRLSIVSGAIQIENKNDGATTVAASGGTVTAAAPQWAALSVSGGVMTAYLNGTTAAPATTVASASVTSTTTVTTCSFGALRNNGATGNYFGGSIFEIAVFKGLADMTAIGTYFTAEYLQSINRTY